MMRPAALALSVGDPLGIGPEIATRAAKELLERRLAIPIIIGPSEKLPNDEEGFVTFPVKLYELSNFRNLLRNLLPFDELIGYRLDIDELIENSNNEPESREKWSGESTIKALQVAVELQRANLVSGIVAGPHTESSVKRAGWEFAGYPDILPRIINDGSSAAFLMLLSGDVRVVHVTLHKSVRDAIDSITTDLVYESLKATISALNSIGIRNPRIGVGGLNPHAGEGGLFGDEERSIIEPAIRRIRDVALNIEGPIPTDLLFSHVKLYDALVVMLHDQGHVPMKFKFGRALSAMTIGLDLSFASVGHGSARDISGLNRADWRPFYKSCMRILGIEK